MLTDSGILLGITSEDVEYAFDEDYSTVAFVKENELWVYKINGGKLTRVFGFPQSDNMDYRDFYDKNNIKILSTDQSGNVWYCVSGYMNRGAHEGENGIALYYYEDASATSEEILFVQTMESYDMLKLDTNSLVYVTDDQEDCYLLLEGIIYGLICRQGNMKLCWIRSIQSAISAPPPTDTLRGLQRESGTIPRHSRFWILRRARYGK